MVSRNYYTITAEPVRDSEGKPSAHGHFRFHGLAQLKRDWLAERRLDLHFEIEEIRPVTLRSVASQWGVAQ